VRADRLLPIAVVASLLLAPAVRAEAPLDPKQTTDLVARFQGHESEAELIERLRACVGDPSGDVSPALYCVLRESLEQQDAGRRQQLSRLAGREEIAQPLSHYPRDLARRDRQMLARARRLEQQAGAEAGADETADRPRVGGRPVSSGRPAARA